MLFRFLDNVEQAIHSPNCPIWDVNFRPLLPPHAQANRSATTPNVPTTSGQPVAQSPTPAVGSTAATGTASAPSSAVIKQEQGDTAESEAMDMDQPYEHPSAAIGSAQSRNVQIESKAVVGYACPIPLVTENGDLPRDLVLEMFRDLDVSQRRGDSDVSYIKDSLH